MCLLCCCAKDSESQEMTASKSKRSCTDCFFLLIFILFCGGLGTIAWYGLSHGDPYRILYGSDSFGNTCGRTNRPIWVRINGTDNRERFNMSGQDMTSKRYMFPLNSERLLDSVWTCVRECPQKTLQSNVEIRNLAKLSNISLCATMEASLAAGGRDTVGICPKLPVYQSTSIINRCIPESIVNLGTDMIRKVVELDSVRSYMSDIVNSADYILKMCAVAFVISLVSVYLLRFFAGFIIFFVYLLVVIVALAISGGLWYSAYIVYQKNQNAAPASNVNITTTQIPGQSSRSFSRSFPTTLSSSEIDTQIAAIMENMSIERWFTFENTGTLTVVGLAIGASVITVFLIFAVWCLFPRGQKMVELFRQSSKALGAMPILLIQPVITAFFVVLVCIYSMSIGFVLYTAGEDVTNMVPDGDGGMIAVIKTNTTTTTKMMLFYQFVGFVWLSEFLMACQRLFIAGAISIWYFNSRRREPGQTRSAICSSMKNLVCNHLGSAALGSFIITLVRVPKYILMYIYAKMKNVENPILKALFCCFIAILACIEGCLRYITVNAYTVIAYSGISFCPAAKTAVNTLLDHAVDAATVNTVGDFVLFLCKCIIATITTVLAGMLRTNANQLSHPWLPLLVIFICSYLIANCFLSVYEMAIDTLFLCCIEDAELSRGNPDHEYSNKEFRGMLSSYRTDTNTNSSNSRNGRNDEESIPLRDRK